MTAGTGLWGVFYCRDRQHSAFFSLWKGKQALIGHPLAWKPFRQVLVTILFLWSLACTEEVSRPVWIMLPLCECSWC